MDKKEFDFILQKGEDFKTEFRENLSGMEKDVVAFANAEGGRLLIGIDDKMNIKGFSLSNHAKSEIHSIARNCDPPIAIDISSFEKVVVIDVPESENKPHKCKEGFYLRQGATSQKLNVDEIRDFFRKEGKILFDEVINKDFSFKSGFDKAKFEIFLQKAKMSRVIPDKDILRNLGVLAEDGKFRNAGVLFFCSNVERFFRQAIITCVLYKGNDKYKIIDRKDFVEDALSNYHNAMAFLLRNLRLEYIIEGFGPRTEVLEIPEDALKEAVVNAMAHRDYNEKGANIQIDIFDDRVEISNPGGLVPAIKKEEFGKKSISRNPLLFSLFKSADLVEKIGSGIGRMRKAMRKAGLPAPSFAFTGFFTVTFKRPQIPAQGKEIAAEKVGVRVTEKVTEKVTENQRKIIDAMRKNPFITVLGIMETVLISRKSILENIAKLKEKGLIARKGPDKGGHWEVLK